MVPQWFIDYGTASKVGKNEIFEEELHFMLPSNVTDEEKGIV
jgi:hypothetical protein